MLALPLQPVHPERTCWGCDRYCPADDLRCGNDVVRAQHPVELFGPEWCVSLPDAHPAPTIQKITQREPQ